MLLGHLCLCKVVDAIGGKGQRGITEMLAGPAACKEWHTARQVVVNLFSQTICKIRGGQFSALSNLALRSGNKRDTGS